MSYIGYGYFQVKPDNLLEWFYRSTKPPYRKFWADDKAASYPTTVLSQWWAKLQAIRAFQLQEKELYRVLSGFRTLTATESFDLARIELPTRVRGDSVDVQSYHKR